MFAGRANGVELEALNLAKCDQDHFTVHVKGDPKR